MQIDVLKLMAPEKQMDIERECRVPPRSRPALIFDDPLVVVLFFCLILISYTPR